MTAVSASALCLSTADFANATWLKFPAASYQYLCMQIQKKKKTPAISDHFADSLQRKRQSLQLERNRSRLRCFKANLYEQQSLMYVSEATGLRARYGINGASLRAL